MLLGSMVESSCRGTSSYAHPSHWTDKEGDDQTVHYEGIVSSCSIYLAVGILYFFLFKIFSVFGPFVEQDLSDYPEGLR